MTLVQAESVRPTEAAQDQRSPDKEFRPDIEGLRAVAVVAVVLFHADMPGVGGGFVGVDVFFVISGFLITGLLWREVSASGTVGLRRFYGARARRSPPASATVGIVTMIGAAILLPSLQTRGVLDDGIASALYVSNYWFIAEGVDYFGGHLPPSPFQHYWSLGVEEQFYLVWPALIIGTAWLLRRVRRRTSTEGTSSQRPYLVVLALVAAGSFALSLLITYVMPAAAFFSRRTRAWQLAAGGLVALTAGQWRRLSPLPAAITGWGGLALILWACTQLSSATMYPGVAVLLPTLGAVLVIGAGVCRTATGVWSRAGVVADAGGRPGVVFVVSLALAGAGARTGTAGSPAGADRQAGSGRALGGLAVLTLRFIENPLRFAAPVRRSALVSLALGGAATLVAVCVGVALLVVVPTPIGRGRGPPWRRASLRHRCPRVRT